MLNNDDKDFSAYIFVAFFFLIFKTISIYSYLVPTIQWTKNV